MRGKDLIFYLGYLYYRVLIKTVRAKITASEELLRRWQTGEPTVVACPHHFLLALLCAVDAAGIKRPPITLVVSTSDDGELIARILKRRGYLLVRGSSRRGSVRAALQLKQYAQDPHVPGPHLGIAYDGPKGPPLIPKEGLAWFGNAVKGQFFFIVGKSHEPRLFKWWKAFRVKSWDRMLIPIPFCSLEVRFEPLPQHLPHGLEYGEFVLETIKKRGFEEYGYLYEKKDCLPS